MKGLNASHCLAFYLTTLLSACGGGGGGGGGGEGGGEAITPPQTESPRQAAINGDNVNALAFAGLRLASYSDGAISMPSSLFSTPGLLSTATRSNGRIAINYSQPCYRGGEIRYTGDLAENTLAGDLLVDYQDCSFVADSVSKGRLKIAITASNQGLPSTYTFALENYAYSTGSVNLTTNGNVDVRPGANGHPQATNNLTIVDNNTGHSMSAKNFVSLYNSPLQYSSPQPAQRSGTIEHSAWGMLDASTPADRNDRLILKGAQPGVLRIDAIAWVASSKLALDADGDGIYDAFSRIYDIDGLLNNATGNTAPTFTPPTGLTPATNVAMQISLSGVHDSEADFLRYSVRAVSSPPGSVLSPQLQEDELISLTTGGPGDYIIELTIDDGRGGVTVKQIAFRVPLPAPQLSVTELNTTMNGSDTLAVDLAATNPAAGPFSYQLVSGPAGMNIDGLGQLRWQPQLYRMFFPSLDVTASVKISNADHSVTVPIAITLNSTGSGVPLARSAVALPTNTDGRQQIFVGDFDDDGQPEVLLSDNKRLIYTLAFDSGDFRQDWVYPYTEEAANIDQILPIDLDNDGRHEIIVQRGSHIAVINEDRSGLDRQADISTGYSSVYAKGMQVADLDNDGAVELVVLFSNDSWSTGSQKAVVLDAATLTERWRSPDMSNTTGMAIGNVDGDPALELVFGGGYVFDGATRANQWLYGSQFGTRIITADIDGDGIDEILSTAPTLNARAFSAVSRTLLWSIPGTSGATITAAQLDADSGRELLLEGVNYLNEIRIYDADQVSATLTDTITPPGYNSGGLVPYDLDQDDIDEIFRFAADVYGSGGYRLVVYNVATATVDYQNSDTQLLNTAWFGGFTLPTASSDLALFSSGNGRFATIDTSDGALIINPATHNNQAGNAEFCLADYDGDNAIEILASSFEYYSGVIFAYDLHAQTEEWTRASNHSSYATTACADLNGDGHADFILNTTGGMEAYDVFNQTLLWSITDAYPGDIGDIVTADLDGDGTLEIIRADGLELTVYAPQGTGYIEQRRVTLGYYSIIAVLVTDIGDGGAPEIAVAVGPYWGANVLVVLNADLSEHSRHTLPFQISALEHSPTADATVLAGTSDYGSSPWQLDTEHFIRSISLTDGAVIWRSPPLVGPVTRRSLHYHPAANGGDGGLQFGTSNAMYITR